MAHDAGRRDWSLMTKAHNGTVSLLRDLTLAQARAAYEGLDPNVGVYYRPVKAMPGCGTMYVAPARLVGASDIVQREVIGPPGWDRAEVDTWDRWPKHRTGEVGSLSMADGETLFIDGGLQRHD